MSLVLAIEPDPRQADALRQIVRDRIGAELELVASTHAAVVSMNRRVPDLLLLSASISSREQDKVVQYFRSLTQVPDQPALTIARFRHDDEPRETPRFGFRRRHQTPAGSRAQFAELIAGALVRVQDARPARDGTPESAPHTQPDVPLPAAPRDGSIDLPLREEPPAPASEDDTLAVILSSIDAVLEQSRADEPAGPISSETTTIGPTGGQPVPGPARQAASSSMDSDEGLFAADLNLLVERLDVDSPSMVIEATGTDALMKPHADESRSSRDEGTRRGAGFWRSLLRSRTSRVEADIHADQNVTGTVRLIPGEAGQPLPEQPSRVLDDAVSTLSQPGRAEGGDDGDRGPDTQPASDDPSEDFGAGVDVARARADADALRDALERVPQDARDARLAAHHATRGARTHAADDQLFPDGAEAAFAAQSRHARAEATERVARLGSFQAEAEALLAIAVTEARAVSDVEARNALGAELAKVRSAAEHALTETVRQVRSDAEQTFAAELSRVRAETERTVNELGLARAEADYRRDTLADGNDEAKALRAAAVEEARRVAEEAAARALDTELARVREDAEVRLQSEFERARQSAHAARLAERDAHVEAERRRDVAAREAREAANAAAALALETQVAQVRNDAEHLLHATLERVQHESERTRRAEQSETRFEVERLLKAAARDLRSAAEEAAARALETEVARIGAEAETCLQTEVTRIRREVEHVRLSAQADARIEAARVREAATQEARAIAEVTLKAELERVRTETRARLDAEVASLRAKAEQRYDTDVVRSREQGVQIARTAEIRRAEEAGQKSAAEARQKKEIRADRRTYAVEQLAVHGRSDARVEPRRPLAAPHLGGWRRATTWALAAAAGLVLIAGGSRVVDVTPAFRAAQSTALAWFTSGDTASPSQDTASIAAASAVPASPRVGVLRVESTPAGARVLLDGRERGRSPLTLTDVRAGRHTLVLRGTAGTVTRTVTVRAQERTVAVEDIVAGFLTVFSRIRLDIYLGDRRLGTTEDGQLLLAPGRHTLTLANDHFNYRTSVIVDIQPGVATSHTVALPNGSLRVNATPGAEVWIEGERVGTAPLGELSVPIGTREVLVKDPEHGERRQFVEVRYGHPTEVTVALNTIANEDHLVRLAP